MKKENKKGLIYFFGNFTYICLTLLGLFYVYKGVAAGFLDGEMVNCIAHLIFGTAFTGMGLLGLDYMLEYWRDKR